MSAQIEIRDLTYTYPGADQPILSSFDLDVNTGELLLVAGKSGVGKSSLLRVFNGLVPHFHGGRLSGSVRVCSRDPVLLGPRGMSDRVGFVNQDPEAQLVASYVEDELAFAMENHGLEPTEMARRIEEVLDRMSMAHLLKRRVDTLSGGELQRVALAGVLTLRPAVLVLDEPTSQLDPESAEEVLQTLDALKAQGLTLIVSEHRLERIVGRADRVLLMSGDGAHRLGRPSEVLVGSSLAPPLLHLASSLGWEQPPVTLDQARLHPRWPSLKRRLTELSRGDSGEEMESASETPARDVVVVRGLEFRYGSFHYDGGQSGRVQSGRVQSGRVQSGRGQAALKDMDFTLPAGTLTALMGRNGSGKSTLMKCLMGLLSPQEGEIRLYSDGQQATDPKLVNLSELSRWVGFVPQNPSRLLFHDTVDSELQYGLKGPREQDIWQRSAPLFAIEDLGSRHPRDLSTGERQRLAVATIVIMGPRLLLLDEPTRGLDVASKGRFTRLLRALVEDGMTVLTATHDVEWVAKTADRVVILEDGKVADAGSVRQVLGRRAQQGAPQDESELTFVPQIVALTGTDQWLTPQALLASIEGSV